jgi:hypothetical protein
MQKNMSTLYICGRHAPALRSNVDNQITDRQNVDKITENVDFILTRLAAPRRG